MPFGKRLGVYGPIRDKYLRPQLALGSILSTCTAVISLVLKK
jgi:hypothetical protein